MNIVVRIALLFISLTHIVSSSALRNSINQPSVAMANHLSATDRLAATQEELNQELQNIYLAELMKEYERSAAQNNVNTIQGDEQQQPLTEMNKRAQTFVRFGKRGQTFIRFG